ncbi:serine/threonine protein phosphatase [Sphingorhabdus lutea]|uniref:Serine/threonine protein phosphatase n=1 Tax=Sphingorhabdus lutea TaxID=1913578 RepID=A0A1L3JB49_9SPHN|nr:metallophosphoesterase [Sphingorhabdus lutea]APG62351.1 serine/threonine protein phosphatase [Sphingorhabdus lutea]
MFGRLLKSLKTEKTVVPASIPDGMRVYAIGDIHGRNDLLVILLDMIKQDMASAPNLQHHIIFLGDLVDRGDSSADVIDTCINLQKSEKNARFIAGNHEEVFVKAYRKGDAKTLRFFLRIGGKETLLSYPISKAEFMSLDYEELADRIKTLIPEEHIIFMENFEDMIVIGDYAFVHAGVREDRPLQDQKTSDLRWIREDFLSYQGNYEKKIIYGHTIYDDVEEGHARIGIDTGAYKSGILTAIVLEGSTSHYLQTGK